MTGFASSVDYQYLENILNDSISGVRKLNGGDINEVYHVRLVSANDVVIKLNPNAPERFFECEQNGLRALAQAYSGKVPTPMATGVLPESRLAFILLEYIEAFPHTQASMQALGVALAQMHHLATHTQFGWNESNFIGQLPQINTQENSWVRFFIDHRIVPQIELGVNNGHWPSSIFQHLAGLERWVNSDVPDEQPCLVHGDLWSGNTFSTKSHQPVLIDPAVYVGHREMELAFTKLFGGFSASFYEAYNEVFSLEKGFENRVQTYNLYPILVHANLFGGYYVNQAKAILSRF